MATLREIRSRIGTVKSTQQITRAMKMVAAAKLRKLQGRLTLTRDYVEELSRVVGSASRCCRKDRHAFMQRRPGRRVCFVLITGDRGLCGSFNANLIRRAEEELHRLLPQKPCLVTIGRKGYEHFRRLDYPISASFVDMFNQLSILTASEISQQLTERFLAGEIDRVMVVYNEFHTLIHQRIVVRQYLPWEAPKELPPRLWATLYEPDAAELVNDLLPQTLRFTFYRMLLESFTAEQAARMTAMEQASENAEEMIRDLVLYYNKTRQAAITKELSEIVGGAEALRR